MLTSLDSEILKQAREVVNIFRYENIISFFIKCQKIKNCYLEDEACNYKM